VPKLPRDISGRDLVKVLSRIGYSVTRQTGSHIRLTRKVDGSEHHLTIPDHAPVRIGTLNRILGDLAAQLGIERTALIERLWGA
jgi:predicted RNA binding protein YcfA (HicA-like mRNA interferase family)